MRISYLRAPRLVIVGAVHVAQALATIAREAGLEPVIVDPRAQLATRERFPGVTLRVEWPEEALVGLALDARTSLVTLTHEPRLDEPALSLALASPAFYVGALGSRRAHEARCLRLREAGVSERDLARLHAPAGLPIGARTPGEIAVSILAEIIQARRA